MQLVLRNTQLPVPFNSVQNQFSLFAINRTWDRAVWLWLVWLMASSGLVYRKWRAIHWPSSTSPTTSSRRWKASTHSRSSRSSEAESYVKIASLPRAGLFAKLYHSFDFTCNLCCSPYRCCTMKREWMSSAQTTSRAVCSAVGFTACCKRTVLAF